MAASPARTAGQTWGAIAVLIAATLERSHTIERAAVEATMGTAAGVGRMLVAGGHLDHKPLTLVAGELVLEITTVSGDKAIMLEENLTPVPGGASAPDWMVHLPMPAPLAALVAQIAESDAHLSAEEPKAAAGRAARQAGSVLDETALEAWAEEAQ